MVKKHFHIDMDNLESQIALTSIAEGLPCFIWEEDDEIVIECREEDYPVVDCILKSYIC